MAETSKPFKEQAYICSWCSSYTNEFMVKVDQFRQENRKNRTINECVVDFDNLLGVNKNKYYLCTLYDIKLTNDQRFKKINISGIADIFKMHYCPSSLSTYLMICALFLVLFYDVCMRSSILLSPIFCPHSLVSMRITNFV